MCEGDDDDDDNRWVKNTVRNKEVIATTKRKYDPDNTERYMELRRSVACVVRGCRYLPPRHNAVPKEMGSAGCMTEGKLTLTSVMRGERFHHMAVGCYRNEGGERMPGVGAGE